MLVDLFIYAASNIACSSSGDIAQVQRLLTLKEVHTRSDVSVRSSICVASLRNRTVNNDFKWVTFHFVVEKKESPLTGVV